MKDIEQLITMKGIASKIEAFKKANPDATKEEINAIVSETFRVQDKLKQENYLVLVIKLEHQSIKNVF